MGLLNINEFMKKVICPGRSKQYLLNHTNMMLLHCYTQGCYRRAIYDFCGKEHKGSC